MFGKDKTIGNGKVIICDFRKLDPKNFIPVGMTKEKIKESLMLCSTDGKMYFKKGDPMAEWIADIFGLFVNETAANLNQYKLMYGKHFPKVKNIEDIEQIPADDPDRVHALAVVLVPVELNRRKIEAAYYGKIRIYK